MEGAATLEIGGVYTIFLVIVYGWWSWDTSIKIYDNTTYFATSLWNIHVEGPQNFNGNEQPMLTFLFLFFNPDHF